MDLSTALEFARTTTKSVLTTIRADGRPQLSNVLHVVGDDGVIRVSITTARAKYVNLRRTPWAALHVTSDDFWAYAVLEGDVTLSDVATSPDDPAVDELVAHYRAGVGEHPDWDDFRAAMVRDGRVLVRLRPDARLRHAALLTAALRVRSDRAGGAGRRRATPSAAPPCATRRPPARAPRRRRSHRAARRPS